MQQTENSGFCHCDFKSVRKAFGLNFDEDDRDGERMLGGCVSAVVDGETVVDLWGGYANPDRTARWQEDTIVTVFSISKAVASFCIYVLYDRSIIDIDAPVASYWPAFAQNGKAEITIRTVLTHQAGLLNADSAREGSLWQTGALEGAIETMAPEWTPGTGAGYHSFTYGPILQGIVRRVTGKSLGRFLREEITEPLGADFFFGLTDEENARCAQFVGNDDNGTIGPFRHQPETTVYQHWKALPRDEDFNSDKWRRQEFPSLNGHGNARGLAQLFACIANGGELDGTHLLARKTIDDVTRQHWQGIDRFAEAPGRFNAGCQMSSDLSPFGGRRENFGFYGIGGSVGFCDPVNRIGFSYCTNRAITGAAGTSQLSVRLIEALYASLNSRTR